MGLNLIDQICSGSLLGVHYRRIQSISVGYKNDYDMYSLDFEEYLWAAGYFCAFLLKRWLEQLGRGEAAES